MTGRLVILVGIPASGKSTIAAEAAALGWTVVNPDSVREALLGDANDHSREPLIWDFAHGQVRTVLGAGGRVVFDATNVRPTYRYQLAEIADTTGADCHAIRVNVDFGEACRRNQTRARVVPDDVMASMWNLWIRHSRPQDLVNEGWTVHHDSQILHVENT